MDYFIVSPRIEADMAESAKIIQKLFVTFDNVFSGIGCLEGTSSLQV